MRTRMYGGVTGEERSEEHTSELQSRLHLVCRLLLEKKKTSRLLFSRDHAPPAPHRETRPDPGHRASLLPRASLHHRLDPRGICEPLPTHLAAAVPP